VPIPDTWCLDLNRTDSRVGLALRQVTVSNDALSAELIPQLVILTDKKLDLASSTWAKNIRAPGRKISVIGSSTKGSGFLGYIISQVSHPKAGTQPRTACSKA
jgi:hypothetical protein